MFFSIMLERTILDSALIFINRNARVVVCGAISQYNSTSIVGPKTICHY